MSRSFYASGPGLLLERFLSFVGDIAFGAGAESMAAGQPHGVAAPESSASTSSDLEIDSYPLIEQVFFASDPGLPLERFLGFIRKMFLELGLNPWQLVSHMVL